MSMMQPSLFESPTIQRDVSLKRVLDHANDAWVCRAKEVLYQLACSMHELTSNDVEDALAAFPEVTPERRAMGGVMKHGQTEGWIAPTDRIVISRSPKSHGCNRRVWKSLVFRSL